MTPAATAGRTTQQYDGGLPPQEVEDPRPAEFFDPYYAFTASHKPGFFYGLLWWIFLPVCLGFFRSRARGRSNIPRSGGVIFAATHLSAMDHFFIAWWCRIIRFVAKSQLFGQKQLDWVLLHGGVVPVRRGQGDDRWLEVAKKLVQEGWCVLVYPEGGRWRGGPREAKPGVGRLALETGAPVVPVGIFGSQNSRPWTNWLKRHRVWIQFGKPMYFGHKPGASKQECQEAADLIFAESLRQEGYLRAIAA